LLNLYLVLYCFFHTIYSRKSALYFFNLQKILNQKGFRTSNIELNNVFYFWKWLFFLTYMYSRLLIDFEYSQKKVKNSLCVQQLFCFTPQWNFFSTYFLSRALQNLKLTKQQQDIHIFALDILCLSYPDWCYPVNDASHNLFLLSAWWYSNSIFSVQLVVANHLRSFRRHHVLVSMVLPSLKLAGTKAYGVNLRTNKQCFVELSSYHQISWKLNEKSKP